MRQARGLLGVVLLLASCGGSGVGQTGTGGNGGGRGGVGGGGPTGGAGGAGGGATGGAAGGPSCTAVTTACGGNVVGTWKVVQTCLTATVDLASVCPGASATYDYMLAGTVTYNADLTYSSAPAGSTAQVHQHYPSGCVPFGYTCAQLEQLALDAGTGNTCATDATGACNCDGPGTLTTTGETGTYTASGGTLTTMHGGKTSLSSYCVQGSFLYASFEQQPDGGTTSAVGIVILAKQ